MLKLRPGIGALLTIIIIAAVGAAYWFAKPSSVLDDYLAETPPPSLDDMFVGEELGGYKH